MAKRVSKKSGSVPEEPGLFNDVQDSPSDPAIATWACWDCRTYYEVAAGLPVVCPNCGSNKARTLN